MLRLVCFLMAFAAVNAHAEVQFHSFRWQASGRFFLTAKLPQGEVDIKGDLRDGQQARVEAEEGITAELAAYTEGFVAVVLTELGSDHSDVSILERQNGRYVKIHTETITANAGSALNDLAGSLTALKQTNGWDASLSFRALVGYFSANQGKTVKDFYDAVEVGHIKAIPKPAERGQLPTRRERPGQFDVHPQGQQQQPSQEYPRQQQRPPPQGPYSPYDQNPYGGMNDQPPPGWEPEFPPEMQRPPPRQQRQRQQPRRRPPQQRPMMVDPWGNPIYQPPPPIPPPFY